jgi:hypothetical protein
MVSPWIKAGVVDFVLLLFGYLVLEDLQWRSSYAISESLSASYTYLPFVRSLDLSGRIFQGQPQQLISPPTFDWIQFLVAIGVAVTLWYAYAALKKPSTSNQPTGETSSPS